MRQIAACTRPRALLRALCILAVLVGTRTNAQTRHDLHLGRELAITGTGLAFNGIGLLLARGNADRPAPIIDIANVPRIDRVATTEWSVSAHRTSNILFGAVVITSVAGSIVNQQGERPLLPVAIIAESALLTSGLTNTVKELVRRPRPYLYNPDVPASLYNPREDDLSFWSGHTANTAAITFSTACMVQRSEASPGVKTMTWIGAAVAPAAMGYLRVRAGRHFPTDVLTGYLIGAAVGIAVPYFHRNDELPR